MRPVPNTRARDFRLYETQAILRYIDTLGPATAPALQPRDPHAAARMNQIVGIVDWYVFPTISVGITAELARLKGDAPFMTGDNVSIADLMLAPHFEFFRATPEGVDILSGDCDGRLADTNEPACEHAGYAGRAPEKIRMML